jgi:hypothetical protein
MTTNPDYIVYEIRGESDLTEGHGGPVTRAILTTIDAALERVADPEFCLNYGFYGQGGFEINKVTYASDEAGDVTQTSTKIWGSRLGPDGKYRNGFIDLRDEPDNDPEYTEYVRLANKFGKRA